MNINKNKKLLLAMAVVIMLNFNSCKKYEDGPRFSLKTKTSRLVGEWEVIKIDGENFQDDNLYLEFDKGGDFTATYEYKYSGTTYKYSYEGSWEWDSKKEVIEVDLEGENLEWEVLRLSKDELWFEDEANDLWECEKK